MQLTNGSFRLPLHKGPEKRPQVTTRHHRQTHLLPRRLFVFSTVVLGNLQNAEAQREIFRFLALPMTSCAVTTVENPRKRLGYEAVGTSEEGSVTAHTFFVFLRLSGRF